MPRPPHPILVKLRIERRKRELSQREVGKMLGFASNTISTWECGRRIPTCMELEAYANLLGFKIGIMKQGKPASEAPPDHLRTNLDEFEKLAPPRRSRLRTQNQQLQMHHAHSTTPEAA